MAGEQRPAAAAGHSRGSTHVDFPCAGVGMRVLALGGMRTWVSTCWAGCGTQVWEPRSDVTSHPDVQALGFPYTYCRKYLANFMDSN